MSLEVTDSVGRMPFRMQQHRQVVYGHHDRQFARQRNVVGLVVQVAVAGTEVLVQLALDPELPRETDCDSTAVDQPQPSPTLQEPWKKAARWRLREQPLLAGPNGAGDPSDGAMH